MLTTNNKPCNRCGRFGHIFKNCYVKLHITGYKLSSSDDIIDLDDKKRIKYIMNTNKDKVYNE